MPFGSSAPTPVVTPAMLDALASAQSAQLQGALSAQSEQMKNLLSGERSDLKNDLFLYVVISSVAILALAIVLIMRTRGGHQIPSTQAQEGPTSQDFARFVEAANNLRAVLVASGKMPQPAPAKPQPTLEEVGNRLTPIISKELVRLLQESENGKLKAKLIQAEEQRDGLRLEYDTLSREIEPVRNELQKSRDKEAELAGLLAMSQEEKARSDAQLTTAQSTNENLKKESEQEREKAAQLILAKEEVQRKLHETATELQEREQALAAERALSETRRITISSAEQEVLRLTEAARLAYSSLAPSRLLGTELVPQIEALHREALAGEPQAVSAWSTLASFGSAQMDPAAKDFQLQIVRRMGVVLVQYWKQRGLAEKERHEHLSLWAKHLNEHADGRYNLFVPGLGAPIDKTRMVCASAATTVREVLCWQIRNPAGANFMLAEVA